MKKNMNKTTKKASAKTPAKKASKNAYTSTYSCDNVSKLNTGMYRARKMVNGVRLSRNFTLLRDAKTWVNSL